MGNENSMEIANDEGSVRFKNKGEVSGEGAEVLPLSHMPVTQDNPSPKPMQYESLNKYIDKTDQLTTLPFHCGRFVYNIHINNGTICGA